jgi:hypothetical protein
MDGRTASSVATAGKFYLSLKARATSPLAAQLFRNFSLLRVIGMGKQGWREDAEERGHGEPIFREMISVLLEGSGS